MRNGYYKGCEVTSGTHQPITADASKTSATRRRCLVDIIAYNNVSENGLKKDSRAGHRPVPHSRLSQVAPPNPAGRPTRALSAATSATQLHNSTSYFCCL